MGLEHAILGFLERGAMSGYDIKTRCFDRQAAHVWTVDQSQLYRTLDRLRERGMVRAKRVPGRGRPDRLLMSVTPKGSAALASWRETPQTPAPLRDPFLLQLMVADGADDATIAALLRSARAEYQRRLDGLRERVRAEAPAGGPSRADALREMTLQAAISAERAAIDWADDCLDRIGEGLPAREPGGPV